MSLEGSDQSRSHIQTVHRTCHTSLDATNWIRLPHKCYSTFSKAKQTERDSKTKTTSHKLQPIRIFQLIYGEMRPLKCAHALANARV